MVYVLYEGGHDIDGSVAAKRNYLEIKWKKIIHFCFDSFKYSFKRLGDRVKHNRPS